MSWHALFGMLWVAYLVVAAIAIIRRTEDAARLHK
jgi:hypothetical protein